MGGVVRVLAKSIPRWDEDRHERVDVEAVDEVVEDRLHCREVEVVAAVMDDEEGIAQRPVEPGRQVDVEALLASQRLAAQALLDERALPRLRVEPHPVRHLIPEARADRRGTERAVGEPRVERVVELLVPRATPDLDLVLDPRPLRQDRRHRPEIGSRDPLHRERIGQTDDTVTHLGPIGLAAPDERRPFTFDDG